MIASGEIFSDALSASNIAAKFGMPLLLVQQNSIPTSIQNYINNHPEIQNFVIVGGTGTISDNVKSALQQLRPNGIVDRVGGANRFEVGINLLNYFGLDATSLSFANGLDFPDGLAVSPLSAYDNVPLLLVTPTSVPQEIQNFLQSQAGIFQFMYLSGGTASVSTDVENQLAGYLP
jgi:putative cell wall-binding protein